MNYWFCPSPYRLAIGVRRFLSEFMITMTQSLQVIAAPSLDLDRLNEQFAGSHPKSILLWCLENMAEGMVQTTA